MPKTSKSLIIIVFLALLIVGYSLIRENRQPSSNEPIKIGALLDLSAEAADWGTDNLKAIELALDEFNQQQISVDVTVSLIVEDAPALDNTKSLNAFQKLVNVDRVISVIGPTWDEATATVAPTAERLKTPTLAPDVSLGVERSANYPYLFSFYYPQDAEARRLIQFMREQDLKRVAILHNIDPFSQGWVDYLTEELTKNQFESPQDVQIIDSSLKDFRTETLKIKQGNPDTVFVVFEDEAAKCPAARQLKELGITVPILSTSSSEVANVLECLKGVEQFYYPYPKLTEEREEFFRKFQKQYGAPPKSPAASNTYDAARLLLRMIANGNHSGESIQLALAKITAFPGVSAESMSFDEKGRLQLPPESFVIKTIKNGVPVVIE